MCVEKGELKVNCFSFQPFALIVAICLISCFGSPGKVGVLSSIDIVKSNISITLVRILFYKNLLATRTRIALNVWHFTKFPNEVRQLGGTSATRFPLNSC